MLIPDVFKTHSYSPKGIIHIGAHMCEEREIYARAGCGDDRVLWIEANPSIVGQMRQALPDLNYKSAVISNQSGMVDFNISSNNQSSSVLEFGVHSIYHPDVTYVNKIQLQSYTLPEFLESTGEPADKYDTLIMDIQGSEYDVLLGAESILDRFRALYLEVNTEEVYKGCGLLKDVQGLLERHSFELADISITPYKWGDAFFLKKVTS